MRRILSNWRLPSIADALHARHGACRRLLVTTVLIAGAACREDPAAPLGAVGAPSAHLNALKSAATRPAVVASEVLARKVPEFGGAYFDEARILNVWVTDLAAVPRLRLEIDGHLARQRRPSTAVRFRKGDFSYLVLEAYASLLVPILGELEVVSVVVDAWSNRLRITVVTPADSARILEAVAEQQIDRNAVRVAFGSYPTVTTTRLLTDRVRPLVGGLQVQNVVGATTYTGSLGAIAARGDSLFAVISAHVANPSLNGTTGQAIYQHTAPTSANQIGSVLRNPAFVGGLPNCPSGKSCRRSDAALVLLTASMTATLGGIAAPTGGPQTGYQAMGALTFNDAALTNLTSDGVTCSGGCYMEMFPGDSASKVGTVTGWTGGIYLNSALSIQGNDGFVRLDNIIVRGHAKPGDSGAPVLDETRTRLAGIQWGAASADSTFLYSVWANVSLDLAGDPLELRSTPPRLLGHENRWIFPPGCPTSPDAWDVYIITGYPKSNSSYEARATVYAGYTTYYCQNVLVDGTFASSAAWQACAVAFGGDCPCAFHTVGAAMCPTLTP